MKKEMINKIVAGKYPKTLYPPLGGKIVVVNELCSCGRMITEHDGFNGHGPSLDGECRQFTWVKWIEGDEEE